MRTHSCVCFHYITQTFKKFEILDDLFGGGTCI